MTITFHPIPDGQYISPTHGRFTTKNGIAFTEYGHVLDTVTHHLEFTPHPNHQDYSTWTPQQRSDAYRSISHLRHREEVAKKATVPIKAILETPPKPPDTIDNLLATIWRNEPEPRPS